MAMKGQAAKDEVMNKVLALFPGSFRNDKELRINVTENDIPVQIKMVLTVSKTAIAEPQSVDNVAQTFQITEEEKIDLENTLTNIGVVF